MIEKLKKYWKELVLAAIAVIVIGQLFDFLPLDTSGNAIFSPAIMLVGIVALFVPAFVGIAAGYFVAKKSTGKAPFLVPAAAGAIAAIVLILFSLASLSLMTEDQWQQELDKLKETGFGVFNDFSIQEFKAFTMSALCFGLVFLAAINFAFGMIGGFVGKQLYAVKNKR